MAANSAIEWTKRTFNPWIGCTRVSRGCVNCYAEDMMADRYKRVTWGPKGARSRTSEGYRHMPFGWDRTAAKAGRIDSVFCASLADWCDDHPSILPEWRAELIGTVAQTQNLEWLMLTKRPENWPIYLPVAECRPPFTNMTLGVSIEDTEALYARGGPLQMAAYCGFKTFVSYGPALEYVDFDHLLSVGAIGQLIFEGESGPEKRPVDVAWAREALKACRKHNVPFFMKQVDKVQPIPEDLKVREFPERRAA